RHAEEVLAVLLELDEVQEASPRLHLHEEVEVALGGVLPSRRRSEEADRRHAVPSGETQEVLPPVLEPRSQGHAGPFTRPMPLGSSAPSRGFMVRDALPIACPSTSSAWAAAGRAPSPRWTRTRTRGARAAGGPRSSRRSRSADARSERPSREHMERRSASELEALS